MKRLLSRRTALAAATILPVANLLPRTCAAEGAWKPAQGIRIVVPAAPGGTTDIVARLLAASAAGLGPVLRGRQQVGRGRRHRLHRGREGRPRRKHRADGQYRPAVDRLFALPQHALRAEKPGAGRASSPRPTCWWSIPRSRPDRAEFVAWLRAQNGKASYASSGTGQSPHLSGAWFLQLTGTKAEHIPYRGAAPALQDLTAGVTQFFFDNLTTGIEFVRAGKLRALGITRRTQSADPRAVPTGRPCRS